MLGHPSVSSLSHWGYLRLVGTSSAEGTVAEVSYHGVQDIFANQGMCGMYQGVSGIAGRDQGFRELVQGAGIINKWHGRNNMGVPGVVSFSGLGGGDMIVSVEGKVGRRRFSRVLLGRPLLGDILL